MVRIKRHLLPKQVENRVDLHHDSDRDEECYIESKQYHKYVQSELNDTYSLNKQKTKQIYFMIVKKMKNVILKVTNIINIYSYN